MSITGKEAKTVDFSKAKIVSTYKNLNRNIADSNDIVSRLTRRLQTSLDLTDIIQMFAEELKQVVRFDNLDFEYDDKVYFKEQAKHSVHTCHYRLSIDDIELGSLNLSRSKKFMEEELAIIERLASTLVFPLKNATMYQAALRSALLDPLTGLGNRRSLDSALHREAKLSIRNQTPLSVVLLDIDYFKQINDSFGHQAGDAVLKQLAKVVSKASRTSDLAFRYGGEEFLLLLNDSSAEQAKLVAERVRRAVVACVFKHDQLEIPVSISLGCATFTGEENLASLVDRADQALYEAKSQGRNRVVSSECDLSGSVTISGENREAQAS